MKFDKEIKEAIFLRRPNRFQSYVNLDGNEEFCHVPNTGRLREILIEGTKCIVRVENNPNRKTKFSLIGAYKNNTLINFDSQMPNKVVEEALYNKKIGKLKNYNIIEREKTYGKSRFDFRLSNSLGNTYFLEVKGVTLENNGIASFPDAKTERGARHLDELVLAKKEGFGAGIIFLVQLEGCKCFTPNTKMDPNFTKSLKKAKEDGVDIFAYDCKVLLDGIEINKKIKVEIE